MLGKGRKGVNRERNFFDANEFFLIESPFLLMAWTTNKYC